MDWKNARNGPLPEDQQEVLIAVDDQKHVAIYHARTSEFKVSSDLSFFVNGNQMIYWTEIKKPGR